MTPICVCSYFSFSAWWHPRLVERVLIFNLPLFEVMTLEAVISCLKIQSQAGRRELKNIFGRSLPVHNLYAGDGLKAPGKPYI